jgi:exonuclease III
MGRSARGSEDGRPDTNPDPERGLGGGRNDADAQYAQGARTTHQPRDQSGPENPGNPQRGNAPQQGSQNQNNGNQARLQDYAYPEVRIYPGPAQPKQGGGKKTTKASIQVAALNIRGNGDPNVRHHENKWFNLWSMMRDEKIGVLITGEAHLDDERRQEIMKLFGRVIEIEFTKDPETANARGLAFVLNKNMVKTDNIKTREIIPGRAMILEMDNVDGTPLSILGVYAPNSPAENERFWIDIKEWYEAHPRVKRPDLFGGDLNVVEDAIDRLPSRPDPDAPVSALDELKTYLRMVDGWRETYPTTRAYTYHQIATGSQSRIDRIMARRGIFEYTFEWDIKTVGIRTDHRMVTTKISTGKAPTLGHGRWVWPAHLTKDKTLTGFIHERGLKLQDDLERVSNWEERLPNQNKQTLWADFKTDIITKARERAKIIIPKIIKEIAELEAKLNAILEDDGLSDDEKKIAGALLTEKLAQLQIQRYNAKKMSTQVRNRLEGEIIGRYWSRLNKPSKPREIIQRLKKNTGADEAPPQYETNSQKMANMARTYHNKLQSERPDSSEEEREEKIQAVLGRTAKKVTEEQAEKLKTRLTNEDVRQALRLSANFKAPGLNGITYELWKTLEARCQTARSLNKPAFDIIDAMRQVFNDIEINGMERGTHFSESWMCPLYKKNDKADIANYRPISLLNTDYKVFTKALTIKLAKVAPDLIHPNQAGFVPGRHIYDQIWLTKRIIELAEASDMCGVIVALDQEKAYDKIEHDYLWRALKSYNIPDEFIDTVKALYSDAYTYVMVNGEKSSTPFRVTRGVRQGDPLSCLLFDLAIEPLAESLRRSNLKGLNIEGAPERLIATLFADDTLVYLEWRDDFGDLVKILNEWCMASGAKFNINKTEMIPIGKEEYREVVRETRCVNGEDGTVIPAHIKIAADGEPIRTLGAWVGNDVVQVDTWARTLEKIDAALDQWELGFPTMEGRRLIILMVVGGMTQYLTKVQGMPKAVEERLEKRIRNFLWAEKSQVTINKETIYAPKDIGGRNLLDIVARNEAISITWLKSYLTFGEDRPLWAYVTDKIMSIKALGDAKNVDVALRMCPYLQKWKPKMADLSEDLARMVKVGEKYDLKMEGLAISREIQREMPIWYHAKSEATKRLFNIGVEVKCLKTNHKIRLVGEAEDLARRAGCNRHRARKDCKCDACKETRKECRPRKCANPHKCYTHARKMLDSLQDKWNPMRPQPEDYEENPEHREENDPEWVEFNPTITTHGKITDTFRIFAHPQR